MSEKLNSDSITELIQYQNSLYRNMNARIQKIQRTKEISDMIVQLQI